MGKSIKIIIFFGVLTIGFFWAIVGATYELIVYDKNKNKLSYYNDLKKKWR